MKLLIRMESVKMITKAAVKIRILKDNREIILPCMRHSDIFYILHELGYKQGIDYKQIAQGFLDEHDNFYNRIAAKKHAQAHDQLKENTRCAELFSEDLY